MAQKFDLGFIVPEEYEPLPPTMKPVCISLVPEKTPDPSAHDYAEQYERLNPCQSPHMIEAEGKLMFAFIKMKDEETGETILCPITGERPKG